MNGNFGISKLLGVYAFGYVLSLQLLRSAHPDWYANVNPPFVLPVLSGGSGTLTSYECYFEMSISPSDGKSIRDILGETPKIVVKNLEGAVTTRIMGWSSEGRLQVAFIYAADGPCIGQVESILDSGGKVRWTNTEA